MLSRVTSALLKLLVQLPHLLRLDLLLPDSPYFRDHPTSSVSPLPLLSFTILSFILSFQSQNFFSRPYSSNGRAIGMVVVRPAVCSSVTDVLWLTVRP